MPETPRKPSPRKKPEQRRTAPAQKRGKSKATRNGPRPEAEEQPAVKLPKVRAPLVGKQRSYLRGLGHHLSPIVLVGKEGVTDGLVGATAAALEQHELIKVRFGDSAGDRHELAEDLARQTKAELVQVIGRIALLYREREEQPAITLPRPAQKRA